MIQQQLPTVGDTVTIVRHIAVPAGAVIDARPPGDSTLATLVAPPVITREGDSVRIAYTVAVWAAGHNDLVLPGAIVVDVRGHVDTLPATHVALDVMSVLPATRTPNTIAPHPGRPWLPSAERSVLPFAVLVPLAIVVAVIGIWWWRRPGPDLPPPQPPAVPALTAERVDAWIEAGEPRLALEHVEALTRARSDMAEWRARADEMRFAAAADDQLAALVREGWVLLQQGPPA
ncbi:MAG TPA: hypothetical protein VGL65_03300 [Gemmatimonadales bacterium]